MLVDQSARIWAMRHDHFMSAEVMAMREKGPQTAALAQGTRLEGSDFARVVDGVAIVPVYGPLMRKMSFWYWSYEEILRDVQLAQADESVRAILFDFDTPGGAASGCGDAARAIRDSGDKPMAAFVGGMCASAGYFLASAVGSITMGSASVVGSIGTVIEYVDTSPMFEKMGAKIVRVVAGDSPNKRLDPHSAEGKAELQALVDAGCEEFVGSIAEFRGRTADEVLLHFGRGLVFDADEGIRRGMADGRGTLTEMIAELAARDTGNAASATAAQESPMDWDSITMAALREHRPDIASEIEDAARTDAASAAAETAAAAVSAERDRILAIDDIAVTGHEELVSAAKKDGKSTAADLALQILQADKAAGKTYIAALAADDAAAAVTAAEPEVTTATVDGDDVGAKAKAAWDKDATLRSEFGGDYEAYLAFETAQTEGRARILRHAS